MKLVPVGAGFAERTVTTSEKFFASLGRVPVLADKKSMWTNVFTDENGLSIDEKNGDRPLCEASTNGHELHETNSPREWRWNHAAD